MPPPTDRSFALRFASISRAPGEPWEREGEGHARFQSQADGLHILEEGSWWDLDRPAVRFPFHKVFFLRRRGPGQVEIGKATPDGGYLPLLVLIPRESPTCWQTLEPHLCSHDLYTAELRIEPSGGALLHWISRGPRKNYETRTQYSDTSLLTAWLKDSI